MDYAINLNNQAVFGTVKIDDERSNWVLPAELYTIQLTVTQRSPKPDLRRGHFFAEFPG